MDLTIILVAIGFILYLLFKFFYGASLMSRSLGDYENYKRFERLAVFLSVGALLFFLSTLFYIFFR